MGTARLQFGSRPGSEVIRKVEGATRSFEGDWLDRPIVVLSTPHAYQRLGGLGNARFPNTRRELALIVEANKNVSSVGDSLSRSAGSLLNWIADPDEPNADPRVKGFYGRSTNAALNVCSDLNLFFPKIPKSKTEWRWYRNQKWTLKDKWKVLFLENSDGEVCTLLRGTRRILENLVGVLDGSLDLSSVRCDLSSSRVGTAEEKVRAGLMELLLQVSRTEGDVARAEGRFSHLLEQIAGGEEILVDIRDRINVFEDMSSDRVRNLEVLHTSLGLDHVSGRDVLSMREGGALLALLLQNRGFLGALCYHLFENPILMKTVLPRLEEVVQLLHNESESSGADVLPIDQLELFR
jgi:hypothetical protein